MANAELPGTRFDAELWADSDEIWSGTIKDQDGNAVDLTDVEFAMLIKGDPDDADDEAAGEGTVEAIVEVDGTVRITAERSQLDPAEYHYMAKAAFPEDYATEALQGKQLPFLHGTLSVRQDVTREAASEE